MGHVVLTREQAAQIFHTRASRSETTMRLGHAGLRCSRVGETREHAALHLAQTRESARVEKAIRSGITSINISRTSHEGAAGARLVRHVNDTHDATELTSFESKIAFCDSQFIEDVVHSISEGTYDAEQRLRARDITTIDSNLAAVRKLQPRMARSLVASRQGLPPLRR
jgi:hypothetical protein